MTALTTLQILQTQLQIATETKTIHDNNAQIQANNAALLADRDQKNIDTLNTQIAALSQNSGS